MTTRSLRSRVITTSPPNPNTINTISSSSTPSSFRRRSSRLSNTPILQDSLSTKRDRESFVAIGEIKGCSEGEESSGKSKGSSVLRKREGGSGQNDNKYCGEFLDEVSTLETSCGLNAGDASVEKTVKSRVLRSRAKEKVGVMGDGENEDKHYSEFLDEVKKLESSRLNAGDASVDKGMKMRVSRSRAREEEVVVKGIGEDEDLGFGGDCENEEKTVNVNVEKAVTTRVLRSKAKEDKVVVIGNEDDEKLGFSGNGGDEENVNGECVEKVGNWESPITSKVVEGKLMREFNVDLNVMPQDVMVISSDDDGDNGFSKVRLGGKFSKVKIDISSDTVTVSGDSSGIEKMDVGDGVVANGSSNDVNTGFGVGLVANGRREDGNAGIGVAVVANDHREDNAGPSEVNMDVDPISKGGRYSREEKGKAKMEVKGSWLSMGIGIGQANMELRPEEEEDIEAAVSGLVDIAASSGQERWQRVEAELLKVQNDLVAERERSNATFRVRSNAYRRRAERERHQDIARENAHRFAHFSPAEENPVNGDAAVTQTNEKELEDWPGPFSTAMKIIRDRASKSSSQHASSMLDVTKDVPVIKWVPTKFREDGPLRRRIAPSLENLCMNIVANNVADVVSLEEVPDVLRSKLCQMLCDSRRINFQFFDLLVKGSPTELRVNNCAWMTEDEATATLGICDKSNLTVLQLDLCGRCMPDYILRSTLACSPNCLPALVAVSLRGGCRITDTGLAALASSAPLLRSINLGQCSLLSSKGIEVLADALGLILRELYIDDCQGIDAMSIAPALKRIENLEVLSVAGIPTVCDELVCEYFTEYGSRIKELNFGNCGKLTDKSLKVISESCSGLRALDIVNLHKLTNAAICYITNGCRSIQTLKLCRNAFSDEAVAAFVETCGQSLVELSLNNIKKVGHHTAISLAKRCSTNLLSLDVSWCRKLSDEALGLIVDSCLSMRLLKLFGCTQITRVFFDGHSNPRVRIIGQKLTPILEYLDVLGRQDAPLRYSSMTC